MNVGELRESLAEFPDDLEILTASDDEGNGYRKLYYSPSIRYILKNGDKHGYIDMFEIFSEDDVKDPEDEDFNEWDHRSKDDVEPRLVIG